MIKNESVDCTKLLNSNVFRFEIDHDSWPSNHIIKTNELRPYNDNLFKIYSKYKEIFPESKYNPIGY